SLNILMKNLLINILSKSGIAGFLRQRENSKGNYVALFHGIHRKRFTDLPSSAQDEFTVEQFEAVLDWLGERFKFLSPEELLNPKIKGGVLITFDDGFRNNLYNALPILERRAVPSLFFISTQHIIEPRKWLWFSKERALSHWDSIADVPEKMAKELYDGLSLNELKEMANSDYVHIGAHTVSHPDLPTLNRIEAENEIVSSKTYLAEQLQCPIDYFAYPRGFHNEDIVAICKKHFEAAFAVDVCDQSNFVIPRVSLHSDGNSYLDVKFSPLHKRNFRRNGN
ncbi:polysaccharide deacetylase family protein, partial [Akkermansiaceae bacterium]|nr:polysaccharide deacetylase family protein [Akkermansiaceae bacterium]